MRGPRRGTRGRATGRWAGSWRAVHRVAEGRGNGVSSGRAGRDEDPDLVDAVLGVVELVGPVVAVGVVLEGRAGGEGDHRLRGRLARAARHLGPLGAERGGPPERRPAGA